MANDAVVGLADAIDALRAELVDAATRGEGQIMMFSLEPIELTVQVAVTKDAHGKIGWQILEVGGKYEKVSTQTLTLKLAPLWRQTDGGLSPNFAIASQDPREVNDIVGPHS